FIDDGQAVLVGRAGSRVFVVESGREVAPKIIEVEWQVEATELRGYPDYMTKEIHEQPATLRRIARGWGDHPSSLAALLREARDACVVGCGTAGHAALAAQYVLARVAGRRVTFATGSEFAYLRDFIAEGSLVIAMSQSGETIDVIDSVR